MDKVQLANEARFVALEYMVAQALRGVHSLYSLTPKEVEETRKEMQERLRTRTFPELKDAAFSDILAAEIELAVERVYQQIQKGLADTP